MVKVSDIFAPKNEAEEEVFAIEQLAFRAQLAIQKAMNANCVDQKELASRIGCSPARVSQYLSEKGPNLTLKTLAKIFHALDQDDIDFATSEEVKNKPAVQEVEEETVRTVRKKVTRPVAWQNMHANDNVSPFDVAAAA